MLSSKKEQSSSSSRPKTAPSNSHSNRMNHGQTSVKFTHKKPSRNHRVDFEGVSENDLIANGLYFLDDEQMEVYDKFTSLLACHDPFDMVSWCTLILFLILSIDLNVMLKVKILEDALHDAKKKTGIEDYGGTELPTGIETSH